MARNGEEWWNIRSELQKGLSSPQHVKCFLSNADQITREFIKESVKDSNKDFLEELSRLNLECILITYNCSYLKLITFIF